METIKAFQKDERGYYCQPTRKKFYYEEGKTYKVSKNKAKMCKLGFHASANYDISDTVDYYEPDSEVTHYGIVDLNVVDSDDEKSVGDIITIIKFLPQDFDVLSKYDKTGKWICFAGRNWKEFDYEKGFNKLLEADKTGEWICWSGLYWDEFDYKKGFNKLINVDKTGEWICWSGASWKEFDYRRGLKKLIQIDKTGEFIRLAKKEWREKFK